MDFGKILSSNPVTAAVNGIASLGSSLVNYKSQVDTNRANSNINERNNKFNAEQAELQRKWSSQQAQAERNYTTAERLAQQEWQEKVSDPSFQLGRWLNAGLSPAQFSADTSPNGVPSGATPSTPSGASASAANPIAMQSPSFDILSPSQAALNYANAQAIKHEDERKNEMHSLEIKAAGLNIQLGEYDLAQMKPALRDNLLKQNEKLDQDIAESVSRIDVNAAQSYFYNKQGELLENQVHSFAEEFRKRMEEADSRIHVNYSQCRELAQRVAESVARVDNINEQTKGQILSNALNGLEYEYVEAGHAVRMSWAATDATNQSVKLQSEAETAGYYRTVAEKDAKVARAYNKKMIAARATTESLGGLLSGSTGVVRALK